MAENSAAFQIESVLNPNNKSLDIYLNTNFNNNYNIKLFDSDNPSKVYNGTLVPNSFDSTNKNTKTFLLIGENLIPNKQYSITVTNDNNETSEAYNFSFDSISAIADPTNDVKVEALGNRILKVSFRYPVDNLLSANSDDILTNFYGIFYNRLANTSTNTSIAKWDGALKKDIASISPDMRSIFFEEDSKILPVTTIQNHILQINNGVYHTNPLDKSTVIVDQTVEQRIVPPMEVPFSVQVTNTPAKATNLDAISRNELIVKFDNNVLLPKPSTGLTGNILFDENNNPISVDRVSRVDNTFNTLLLGLDSPLNIGIQTLKVGNLPSDTPILFDANGYSIPLTPLQATIESIKPTLKSASQDMNIINPKNTIINLSFSTVMKDDVSGVGANNKTNYTLLNSENLPQEILSAEFGSDKTTVVLTTKELLPTGDYSLVINENSIVDENGEGIQSTNRIVNISDLSLPELVEIIALNSTEDIIDDTSNSIIIKYSTPMTISSSGSQCAANLPINYKFIESTNESTKNPLPENTTTYVMENNKWVRFTLPLDSKYPTFGATDGTPNNNYSIHIGYTGLKFSDYKYVCNASGNVYPLCEGEKIDAAVPLINLSKGNVEMQAHNKMTYNYTDKVTVGGKSYTNEFLSVSPSDFIIKVSENVIDPSNLDEFNKLKTLTILDTELSEDNTSIIFSLEENSLNSGYKYAYVGATTPNGIVDIFGKNITEDVFNREILNSIPSNLVGISLSNLSTEPTKYTLGIGDDTIIAIGYPYEIAVKFSNDIKATQNNDFVVSFKNTQENSPYVVTPIKSVSITNNKDTLLIKGYIPASGGAAITSHSLFVRTNAMNPTLGTVDINSNRIESFDYTPVSNFYILNTTFVSNGLVTDSKFTMTFNYDIDSNSLPSDLLSDTGITNLKFIDMDNTTPLDKPYMNIDNFGKLYVREEAPSENKLFLENDAEKATADVAITLKGTLLDNRTLELLFNVPSDTSNSIKWNMDNLVFMLFSPEPLTIKNTGDEGEYYANSSLDFNANSIMRLTL